MAPDEDVRFDRTLRLFSAASLGLSVLERFMLAPLDAEERKSFRKSYVTNISTSIDGMLRSTIFLDLLNVISDWFGGGNGNAGNGRGTGVTEGLPGGVASELERLLRDDALKAALLEHLAGTLAEQIHARGAERRPTECPPADSWRNPSRNGASPNRPDDTGRSVSEEGTLQQRLLDELHETNRQLNELIALQRQLSSHNGEIRTNHRGATST